MPLMYRRLFHGTRHTERFVALKGRVCHNALPYITSRPLVFHVGAKLKSPRMFLRIGPFEARRTLFIQTDTTPNVDVRIFEPSQSSWLNTVLTIVGTKIHSSPFNSTSRRVVFITRISITSIYPTRSKSVTACRPLARN